MSVVNVKATALVNADNYLDLGLPVISNPVGLSAGKDRVDVGLCAGLTTDSANSVYRFARVNSADMIDTVEIVAADAMSGFTALDIGVYDTEANGGGAVSQHLFKQGYDPHTGLTAPVDFRYAALAANTVEQPLWLLLGLSADPGKSYDLAGTATTRGSAAGNLAFRVRRVTPNS